MNTANKSNTENLDREVCLNGWVSRIRNLGKIMFFDLQYAGEQTQVAVKNKDLVREVSAQVKTGDLITVSGKYQAKEVSYPRNEDVKVSRELLMITWKMINRTTTLPFEIKDKLEIKEDNKYRYRYLDLRRAQSRKIIVYKHKLFSYIRNFLQRKDFIEIETPILSQSSPEGAGTFTVPSKIAGRFYTLPQSPQIFKQILMIGGFNKYYQVAKSFRSEDARSNRQPEFLQLDLEMSFISEEEIFTLTEKLVIGLLKKVFSIRKQLVSFQRIKFDDCIEKYGTDKPDLRNPLQIIVIRKTSSFPIFLGQVADHHHKNFGMYIQLEIHCNELVRFISKQVSEPDKYSFFELTKGKWKLVSGNPAINFSEDKQQWDDGFYLTMNGEQDIVRARLLEVRKFCDRLFLNRENSKEFRFLWITEWPLFGYDKNEKKIDSLRHPFTMPREDDIAKLFNQKESHHLSLVKGQAYDLVCNGEELASGSLRIFRRDLQEKVFRILGFGRQETEEYFGYFLRALEFAAPPHGGIAFGIERMLAVFLGLKNLKETIAFPKNIDGSCSLTGTPNKIKT